MPTAHRDFPHQSTAQQFFDESQWESYCQLRRGARPCAGCAPAGCAARLTHAGFVVRASAVSGDEQKNRATRRQRLGATIGASLSLGALLTMALSGWQAWDAHTRQSADDLRDVSAQQRNTDALQTALEANTPYSATMHEKLYALMQRFDATRGSGDVARSMNRLADILNQACAKLDQTTAIYTLCLRDYSTLRAAAAAPTRWELAMSDYRHAVPTEGALALGTLWRSLRLSSALLRGQPTSSPSTSAPAALPQATMSMANDGGVSTSLPAPPQPRVARARVPAATAGPAAAPAPDDATQAVWEACSGAAMPLPRRITLYAQIYGESQRPASSQLLARINALGLLTPGIENVSWTARRAGRQAPTGWTTPVFLYSSDNEQGQACARALAAWLTTQPGFAGVTVQALPLPIRLHGDPNVIEFWMPHVDRPRPD